MTRQCGLSVKWSLAEIEALRSILAVGKRFEDVAEATGRSLSAVQAKARVLDLRDTNRKMALWSEEELGRLREIWNTYRDMPPRTRAIQASHRIHRPVDAILAKAREIGLPSIWQSKGGHSGKPSGWVGYDVYRLVSPEEQWKQAWMRAHGTRGYDGKAINV